MVLISIFGETAHRDSERNMVQVFWSQSEEEKLHEISDI